MSHPITPHICLCLLLLVTSIHLAISQTFLPSTTVDIIDENLNIHSYKPWDEGPFREVRQVTRENLDVIFSETQITIPVSSLYFYNFTSISELDFGTYLLDISYSVSPPSQLSNVTFVLAYLSQEKFELFAADPSAFLQNNAFDGVLDLFNYDTNTFSGNTVAKKDGSLLINELRFTENSSQKRYRPIIMKKTPTTGYELTIVKFAMTKVARVYDRFGTGNQMVELPSGNTDLYVCTSCDGSYYDLNDLAKKLSFVLALIPTSKNITINLNVRLSNTRNGDTGWVAYKSASISKNKVSAYFSSTINTITSLYISVTVFNCTDSNGNYLTACPFSFSVSTNTNRSASGAADTAVIVTAVILSTIIVGVIVLASGYFFYRYKITKRIEEQQARGLELSSIAQMSLHNRSTVPVDETQAPHDPFVRLDKLSGYSLDASSHFIMDVPQVTITLAPPSTEPVVQYGVDTAPPPTTPITTAVQNSTSTFSKTDSPTDAPNVI